MAPSPHHVPAASELETQFEEAIAAHSGIVRKVSHLYAEAPEREDLQQEILLQAWRSFPQFRGEARIATWLYRVALNVALSYVRASRRLPNATELPIGFAERPSTTAPNESVALLYGAIRQLPPVDRSLVTLHLDGYAHREIGEFLGVSEGAVTTRLHRAKAKLRRLLNPKTT